MRHRLYTRDPGVGRAIGRGLRTAFVTLPSSALLLAAAWVPLVALLAGTGTSPREIYRVSAYCAFSGLTHYGQLAGAIAYSFLDGAGTESQWTAWVPRGLVALLLQNIAVGVLVHRHYAAEGTKRAFAAGLRSAFPVMWLTLAGAFALAVVHVGIFAIIDATTVRVGVFLVLACELALAVAASRVWLALPATVVERKGLYAALRRSIELTRAAPWRLWVFFLGYSLVPLALLLTYGEITHDAPSIPAAAGLGILIAALRAAMLAHIYEELRSTAELTRPPDVARVFG